MAVLSLKKFSGIAPRVSPYKLSPEMAQTANNVRLLKGTLASWNSPLNVATVAIAGPTSTIYRFGQSQTSDTQYWLNWTADVNVVKGAISGDAAEKTYFTHPTLGARYTDSTLVTTGTGDYPQSSRKLGYPSPVGAPIAAVTTEGDTESLTETRVYVYTYVSDTGDEGPPSAPSNLIDTHILDSTVTLTNLGTTAPADYTGHITAKRIYRTLSGSLSTDYQLVDEIPISQGTYADSKLGTDLGETIETVDWSAPPNGAFGITQMANGIMLVFKGYDIYPSESYVPYAYPAKYSVSVDYPIVGGAAIGTSAVILTNGHPYLLMGSDPSALSLVKLEAPQACSSKRSIAATDSGVMYASPDGLMMVSGSGQVVNVTAPLFSRDEWQDLNPSSMHGYFHDGRYFCFYDTGTTQAGFIFDPAQGTGAFTTLDFYATAGYSDLIQDGLYLKTGASIVKWHATSTPLAYTWKSGKIETTSPTNPACAQVVAVTYPVTFKLYADDVLKHTQSVASKDIFWLPSGYRANFLEVELTGSAEVLSVQVADSPQELKGL